MSKIDELIEDLCPDGVKYKLLGNICSITTGKLDANAMDENGEFHFFTCAKKVYKINVFAFDAEALLISGNGSQVGHIHYFNGKFNAYQRTYVLTDFTENIHYIKHLLKAFLKDRIMEEKNVAGVPYIKMGTLTDFEIPIPPIEIQNEIVRILDNFTELEAELEVELEAELEARTKQYEYYRNKLLNFSNGSVGVPRIDKMLSEMCSDGVSYHLITDVFNIKNGYTPSKNKKEYWEKGTVPWFRMEDIRLNGRILYDSIQHVNKIGVKNGKLFPKDSIIIATSATIGEHAIVRVPFLSNQRFTCLMIKDDFKSKMSMIFMYYYMFIIDEWVKNNTNIAGFASVDMSAFKRLEIPVPPIEIQNEIVSILDKFSKYTTSITEGLPAEIELRKKQYDYYRNKLLTF